MDGDAARALARRLVVDLKKAAFAPISGYNVCCAVRGSSGTVYVGNNLEFGTMGDAVHAEQAAVSLAMAHQEQAIEFLVVGSGRPCGHCLQFLHELKDVDSVVFLAASDDTYERRIKDLLPFGMRPAALACIAAPDDRAADVDARSTTMFSRAPIRPARLSDDEAAALSACLPLEASRSALRAAFERSHSPYTGMRAAVALVCGGEGGRERTFVGGRIESVAFNPSLPPLQAALVSLSAARGDPGGDAGGMAGALAAIERVVLHEDDALGGFSWQPRIEVMLSDILGPGKRVHVRRVGVAAGGARRKE